MKNKHVSSFAVLHKCTPRAHLSACGNLFPWLYVRISFHGLNVRDQFLPHSDQNKDPYNLVQTVTHMGHHGPEWTTFVDQTLTTYLGLNPDWSGWGCGPHFGQCMQAHSCIPLYKWAFPSMPFIPLKVRYKDCT